MHQYKQSGRWQDVFDISSLVDGRMCLIQAHPAIDQTAYIDAWEKYHKMACTSLLPEDGHLDVRNMSKTL